MNGRRLVSSSYYTSLRVWDIKTGKTVMGPLKGHSNVHCVAVHGSHIASCSDDGTFRIVDADSGELVLGPITAHNGKWVNWIAYSRDGSHIATGGGDNRAVLWNANSGVQVRELVGHAAPDGTRLVSGSQDGTVRIWDVSSGECIGKPLTGHRARGHDEQVLAVAFSPDGRRIASASEDRTIALWDVTDNVDEFNIIM
ncbi:WD40 repeat-like protein [Exidia glandulosa HHB12029]|uniref:WD40 repeat-like protein n=1 Tax=Exidia glandulosa HHB12029 TaxID=1314781 RepID=A0A165IV63_EXIGL|nr:WD40 repeat-like protein [Exidia glandulosa HHB12029]